ncbi:MAG: HupE/UreJ family protein [Gemmatimonadetes bacterium]|nr:HupE/UreJ family protein [Gemmatimonadota bacterium]
MRWPSRERDRERAHAAGATLVSRAIAWGASLLVLLAPAQLLAHGIARGDKGFIQESTGILLVPFAYLGAKHMVTGYDHLLFLLGVIFFLYRLRDVALYVTLFAIGHSSTLLLGTLTGTGVNPFLVDTVIGLSVVYKAMENLGAFRRWFGVQPDPRLATLIFGFCHGLGLATKLLEFEMPREWMFPNLVAFNVGVEVGQLLALGAMLIAMGAWRRSARFGTSAYAANVWIMTAGFILAGYQLTGYFVYDAP